MSDILARIGAYKRDEIAEAKRERPFSDVEGEARHAGAGARRSPAPSAQRIAAGQTALIAEIKKASPSKGLIRPDFDPPALAARL